MEIHRSELEVRLTDRRRQILREVISSYVRNVHPVSSSLISRSVQASSATIRNELAALEEMGFLMQPHTSGGRIPTDLAYRFLVEELLSDLSATLDDRGRVADVYSQLSTETETLLEGTLDLLTEMTGYVAWVSLPRPNNLEIRSLNFVEAGDQEILAVLVTANGVMQSRRINVPLATSSLNLARLSETLTNYLRHRSIIEVDYAEMHRIFLETVNLPEGLFQAVSQFIDSMSFSGERVIFSNALRLVVQPEFASSENLNSVVSVLQDRERFIRNLRSRLNSRSVQTIIGRENSDPDLHQVSLVLSRYEVPQAGEGTLGVIGPTRLFYERTLPWIKLIGESIAHALEDSGAGPQAWRTDERH
ncbi:heat-inducible transcription repressor HrcA [bacterium]|nr:heat-inducible transcription repressor HrcA [bacterium]